MSVRDLFTIAGAFNEANSRNNTRLIKDSLQIENGINKNWQDALTFNKNIEAINAVNNKNAYKDQEEMRRLQGEAAALRAAAAYAFDPETGQYRNPYQMQAMSAPSLSRDPYAQLYNMQKAQAAAAEFANSIAAIDPVAAMQIRKNAGLYNSGVRATQLPDGTLNITNSQNYTRSLDPVTAPVFMVNPAKTSAELMAYQRDDHNSQRDYGEQVGLQNNQAHLNRFNNAESLRLQNALNQGTMDHELRNKLQLMQSQAKLQAELQEKYGTKNRRNAASGDDIEKEYRNVLTQQFNKFMEMRAPDETEEDVLRKAKQLTDFVFSRTPQAEPPNTQSAQAIWSELLKHQK